MCFLRFMSRVCYFWTRWVILTLVILNTGGIIPPLSPRGSQEPHSIPPVFQEPGSDDSEQLFTKPTSASQEFFLQCCVHTRKAKT
jgi:hypothetical protein